MPQITYHRTWCKRCENFTLHRWISIDSSKALCCKLCNTEENGYFIKDIPEEKIIEQRKRYKESKFSQLEKITQIYLNPNSSLLNDMMKEPGESFNIIECDAGQKRIDELSTQKYYEKKKELQEKKDDYYQNYVHLQRNEKCSCWS